MFTGLRIDAAKAGKTWEKLTNCIVSEITGSGSKVNINIASDKTGKLYLGTSKKAMFQVYSGIFDTDHYLFTIDDLSTLTRYYFKIKNTAVGEVAETGIYSLKTVEVVIIPIDVGSPAIDRGGHQGTYTYFDFNNPANASGKLTSIEIYAYYNMVGCKVATFFLVSGNNYSTRDYEVIGDFLAGSKKTFPVDIDIQAGDYIGVYATAGETEKDYSGGNGVRYATGDQIPCTNVPFNIFAGDVLSLYGKGST